MLRFSGAFLLEAYDLTSEEATSPRLRWPLIDAFTHLMSEGSTSGLTIGLEDGSEGFTLDLAIPTPVAQTAKEGFSNTSVFPFRVAFPVQGNTNQHQPDHALKVWFGAWGSASDEAHLPSQNRQLGEFGFSCLGDQVIETDLHDRSEHEEFAHLHQEKILTDKPRRKGKKHKHPDTDPNIHYTNSAINWWPVNKIKDYSDISETLKSFGLTTDSTPRCDFLTGFLTGESDSVITPPSELCIDLRIKNNSPNTITYRYTQYAKKGANFSHPTSDIAVRSGKLSLRMKNELDGWIDLDSDKITFQFSLSCPVPSNNPQDRFAINKKAKRANLNPSLYTTLLWDQDIPIDLGKSTRLSQIADERHYRFGTLEDAFRSSRTGRQALERIESNQPQSFLPELETRVSTANEKVRFELVPLEKIDASFCDKNGHLNWSVTTEPTDPRYYLTLPEAADVLTPSQLTYIPINACFPGINSKIIEDSAFLPLKLVHDKPDKESGFATFKIENDSDPTDHSHDFKGRLGSLLFSGKSPLLLQGDETNYSRLTTVPYHSILTNFLSVTRTEEPIGLHLQWNLAINSVHPVTADIPRSSRQNNVPPLVINTSGSDPNGQFILKVEEWIGTGDDWRLIANLSETELEGGPASRSYVVISQEPFGLTRFTRKSLERLGGLESSSVANYHSNRRSWQFKKSVATYRYSLAPQVIGDGTDKPRRHEIHDLPEGDELSDLPPYPTDSNGNDINPIGTYLVDFRLPPSAELWVRPSDLERNYTLPEWSSYEVFRQRNDFGLGASLAGFRGEFLYGLSVGIDTGRKNEPSFGVRVAEIEAITGHVAQRTFTTRPYKTLDTRWDHLKVALKRRPERLEFWVQNSRNSQPFQPARFEEGVSFALRETALHKPAILPPNEGPESTQHFSMPVQTSDGGPRYHNAGLPGGALWPLESWSFFDKLMKNPTSSGGSIEDIALSPTGGDADQSALFLEGNVKIISETRGGLVQKQRVEISGRIGVFWHRAKHVVVYERTVNASAQFAPKERADTRTRRPVLRKVSEFIELLEPVRRYPATGHATARSAG
ncbi:MAG: hypothetical protein JKX76_15090, partial [Colwellia sp.]|nr:hypothetical protein [Colwellia sp.]